MNWNLEADRWKKSTKLLLGLATVWPPIYMVLFFIAVFSFMLLIPSIDRRAALNAPEIDLIQLDRKIRNGEIKELTISGSDVIAADRVSNVEYHAYFSSESTREEIIKEARELDENGQPHVSRIEEKPYPTHAAPTALFPIGFIGLFAAHMITILLIIGLMPLYIVLVVKNRQLDETMRIVWVVLICMLGMLAMPVYWYLYIWRNRLPASAVESSS